ncbi:MAG TPA: dTDP-4-dehydrorhamnose reductase [Nitrospirales bacterium]|nr:dTDP-4-dehydrorhamnose reductase [Nitrospiraceae bacterium]HNP31137.1 dTDP-4-dehydrorhamnose reductase [Nitrospirales bacterium]
MRQSRILITGAQGQLGQALQGQYADHEVTAWDLQDLDITQFEEVKKALDQLRPHLVINAAAFTQVDEAEVKQDAAYRGNALGPRNLAVVTKDLGMTLIHFSTDYVFDGQQNRPYHEFDRTNPLGVYGHSKLAGEEAVRIANPRHFIVRTAWLYHTVGKNFPNTICRMAGREVVKVVSDQYGSPTFAPHLAQAVFQLGETDAFGTYHMAGTGGASWYELTQALYQALDIQTSVVPIATAQFPRPARRPPYAVLTSLQDPLIELPSWEEGVRDFASLWKG